MSYKKVILAVFISFFSFVSIVSALPSTRSEQNIEPFIDSTYTNGNQTKAWLQMSTDELCLNADCKTAWPAGGAGGGGVGWATSTASNESIYFYGLGNVGIGTSTPYAKLGVSGLVVANNFFATSTTATSTFAGAVTGLVETFCFALSDENTALTTSSSTVTFRAPFGGTLVAIRASVASSSVGATIVTNLKESGTSVFSTKLSIDATEHTSVTAAAPYVLSDTAIADDAEMIFEIDQVGSTSAGFGLKECIYMKR